MASPLDRKHLTAFATRLEALAPEAPPRWGRMRALEIVPHLRAALRISLGGVEVANESTALFRNPVMQWLLFGPLPWPKGKIESGPEFRPAPEGDLDAERAALRGAMEQFVDALEREPGRVTRHPAFGELTLRKWAKLHGKHFDHHLKQFGA